MTAKSMSCKKAAFPQEITPLSGMRRFYQSGATLLYCERKQHQFPGDASGSDHAQGVQDFHDHLKFQLTWQLFPSLDDKLQIQRHFSEVHAYSTLFLAGNATVLW